MKCLVTGAAGFIASHLCERLIRDDHDVIGIDALTDYYAPSVKLRNLSRLSQDSKFSYLNANLLDIDLAKHLTGVDYVFHLAAQPGVRASWGKSFESYAANNILASQKLFEASKGLPIRKVVYASSSSVYGDAESFPTHESANPRPVSPYGLSKLAAEQLGYLYWKNYGVPIVSVRYFTVYGPRQRPDMAFHRFLRAILAEEPIEVYGDGAQTRDFTYVTDAVDGTVRSAVNGATGETYNLGGGSRVTVNEVLDSLATLLGRMPIVHRLDVPKGDVRHTGADTSKARDQLGFVARVDLATGLAEELAWFLQRDNQVPAGTTLGNGKH